MNVIFLSPHFPPHYHHFCQALRQTGATVLGLADVPFQQLSPNLQESLTDYYQVSSLEDYDALVRALGYFTHRHGKIDRLDSLNEHWLQTEARLRTDFNIPGIQSALIDRIKRKSVMKEIFRQAKVPVAASQLLPTRSPLVGVAAFIAAVGYPVVIKPDVGVGAAHTHLIASAADLDQFSRQRQPVDYIMEEYVAGDICSFDGLLDQTGNVVFCTSHLYSQGIMDIVNRDLDLAYWSLRDVPPPIEAAGRAVLQALGLTARFFHLEFFFQQQPPRLVALEINMRPPGGLTLDMFNFACDIDLYQEWANILVHNRFSTTYERKYHVLYAGRKAGKPYLYSHAEIVAAHGPLLIHYESINSIFRSAIGDYGYLLRSPTLEPLLVARDYIHALHQ